MRHFVTIVFAIMMIFSSSCAMKKAAMRILDIHHSVPTKAMTHGTENETSAENTPHWCGLQTKTGSILGDLELTTVVEPFQLSTPVLLLLFTLFNFWIYAYLCSFRPPPEKRNHFPVLFTLPLYLQLQRLVFYG